MAEESARSLFGPCDAGWTKEFGFDSFVGGKDGMACEHIKRRSGYYTDLQDRIAHIADVIIAEGHNVVWFVINGEDYYVYDNGDILRKLDMEREKLWLRGV